MDTSKYSLMDTISPSTTDFQFNIQPEDKGFYLAIVDRGVCVQLSRLFVYRHRCAQRQEGLALYPNTAVPLPAETGDVSVQAMCVGNASATGDSCSADGKWTGSPSCACSPGFITGEDQTTGLAICEG